MRQCTWDELNDSAMRILLRAFGKGEDLKGAIHTILDMGVQYGRDYEREQKPRRSKGMGSMS